MAFFYLREVSVEGVFEIEGTPPHTSFRKDKKFTICDMFEISLVSKISQITVSCHTEWSVSLISSTSSLIPCSQ